VAFPSLHSHHMGGSRLYLHLVIANFIPCYHLMESLLCIISSSQRNLQSKSPVQSNLWTPGASPQGCHVCFEEEHLRCSEITCVFGVTSVPSLFLFFSFSLSLALALVLSLSLSLSILPPFSLSPSGEYQGLFINESTWAARNQCLTEQKEGHNFSRQT
jgi:hypothetical protein